MKRIFVSAIGTDSGKTVFSAILATALDADYWKPIQAGRPTDTEAVRVLLPAWSRSVCHPEACLLDIPASPHQAAATQGIVLGLEMFGHCPNPSEDRYLVIEGAGGLMVPLTYDLHIIDLVLYLKAPVILVCNLYLGSINHSLLSIFLLRQKGIELKGIVFNGPDNPASRMAITSQTDAPVLLQIEPHESINPQIIASYAQKLLENLHLNRFFE